MGFWYAQSAESARNVKRGPKVIPIELMKEHACKVCPLNEIDHRRITPKMAPAGPDNPLVYVLLGNPNPDEDATGEHLEGPALEVLKKAIPHSLRKQYVRYGHAVRCRVMGDKKPEVAERTCCSGLATRDIEESKPRVIIGVGDIALRFGLGEPKGDSIYRGRMWPVKVGSHVCWFYQVQDPEFVLKRQKERKYDTEVTIAFRHDLKRIFEMIDDLPVPTYIEPEDRATGIEIIDGSHELHYEDLAQFFYEAAYEKLLGIDIETNALRPYTAGSAILTCAISTPRKTVAFPVDHPQGWPAPLRRSIRLMLYDFLVKSGRKTAHHLGFELEWFCYHLDPLVARTTEWADSYAAAHTLDERGGALSLGATTMLRFGFDVKAMSNIDVKRILEYPLRDVLHYNALDAKWGRACTVSLEAEINENPKYVLEYDRKVRLAPTLVLSQMVGLCVDEDFARKQQQELAAEVETACRLISKAVEVKKFEDQHARPFKPTSDDDVVMLVRDVMRRPEGEQDNGRYSCDEGVLSSIPPEAGIAPAQILLLRGASKLLGTYVEPVLNKDPAAGKVLVYPDGRMHTNYNSMIAETGRLSSDDPNAQNFPKRKRKEIRGMVVCEPGCVFAAVDYGQIEARVFAMASQDKNLTNALWTDFDIHGHWAARCVKYYPEVKDLIVRDFEVDWDEKGLKTLRQEMKNKWVFPQFFGSSFKSCAANLHLPLDVAEEMQEEFWDEYPGIKKWQAKTVAAYERNLYVETLGGRRRRGALSLNQVINTPIQGTAADIVTDGMNKLSEHAQATRQVQFQPPLNVHDDLTFNIPKPTMVEDIEFIATTMCDCKFDYINVPILVEVSVSKKRWHEMEEVGIWRSDTLGFHTR